ncbi:pistil-specific extensin-like protein [Miscanthus floridulus]|uniref:pistil-specific extensin-like protein n=1 Tax=Miscanthus floridulus TaxID=154761 RepID=UPI00345B478B
MSNGDYYVGPPETYTAPEPAAPAAPATKQAPQVTGAAQAPATHNYFVGPPVNPDKTQQPKELAASPTRQPPPKNRSSFLARWFPCICGSRTSEQ